MYSDERKKNSIKFRFRTDGNFSNVGHFNYCWALRDDFLCCTQIAMFVLIFLRIYFWIKKNENKTVINISSVCILLNSRFVVAFYSSMEEVPYGYGWTYQIPCCCCFTNLEKNIFACMEFRIQQYTHCSFAHIYSTVYILPRKPLKYPFLGTKCKLSA